MSRLFVNIDHIATIRNQRNTKAPNLISAAGICEQNGAVGITVHLREDRRHIKDEDVFELKKHINSYLNLEMALDEEIINIALKVKPDFVCIVPEKRNELTTEGGLDIKNNMSKLNDLINEFQKESIKVSLFIEPEEKNIELAKKVNANIVELHTGTYCNKFYTKEKDYELARIINAVNYAQMLDLTVNLGHGIDYINIKDLIKIKKISEFNIGHSIICNSIFLGLAKAVSNMNKIIKGIM
jgi:pyridoxine 5-phosphate synthase